MNKIQAALFLSLLENLVFDKKAFLQQNVVFKSKEHLFTGEFYFEESFFAPFIRPEDQYAFKESFVSRTMPYNGITDYNKPQIQRDLQKDIPETFEKIKHFVLNYKKYQEIAEIETTIPNNFVIKKVQFLDFKDPTFPFFIFPKDTNFEPVSLLLDTQ